MKTKLLLFIPVIGLAIFQVKAQTLSPSVISSSGGFYTSESTLLSFTLAEMALVQTFISPDNTLTQGFQQAENLTVEIPENLPASESAIIYPNPTSGLFTLNYFSNSIEENSIRLYDLLGQEVLIKGISQSTGPSALTIDIRSFNQGTYLLEFVMKNPKGEKQTVYNKINLVY
jgi:hypothetical protein